MVVTLATVDLPGSTSTTLYGPRQLEVAAAILFRDIRRGWPVLTGRSRGGLDYRLERVTASAIRMVVTDRYAYARYVAERWYPLERRLGPQQVSDALREAGMVPEDADRIPSEIQNVTGTGSASRPITVRGVAGQAPAPPTPAPPPPITNPTDLAIAKSLKQVADEPDRARAADAVFGAARNVPLKKLKERVAQHGVQYSAVGLSPGARDTLDRLIDYMEENYPETLQQLTAVKTTDPKKTLASVSNWTQNGKTVTQLNLAKRLYGNKPVDTTIKFQRYADREINHTVWWKFDPEGEFFKIDHRPKVEGELGPPPGWMTVEQLDVVRKAEFDESIAKSNRWSVGLDNRFGEAVKPGRQRMMRTLIHELGHMLHVSRGLTNKQTSPAVYARWRQQTGVEDWTVWAEQISDYSLKNVHEATAEAFALREIYGVEQLPSTARLWLEYLESRPVVDG